MSIINSATGINDGDFDTVTANTYEGNSSLTMTGDTILNTLTINSTLYVSGTTNLNDTTINSSLLVSGSTNLYNTTINSSLFVSGSTVLNNTTINGSLNISGLNIFNNLALLDNVLYLDASGNTILQTNYNKIIFNDISQSSKTNIDSNGLNVLNTFPILTIPLPITSGTYLNVRDQIANLLDTTTVQGANIFTLEQTVNGLPSAVIDSLAGTFAALNLAITTKESAFDKNPPLYLDTTPILKPILKLKYDYNFEIDSNNNLTLNKQLKSTFYFTINNNNTINLNGNLYYKYDICINNYTNKLTMNDNSTLFRKFNIYTWITDCQFNNSNFQENEYSIFMSYRSSEPNIGLNICASGPFYGMNRNLNRITGDHSIIQNDFNNLTYVSTHYNINIGCIINSNI